MVHHLFGLFFPCCFYCVEVEVVVAGYVSCVPQVAGGHRTDQHFHSSDHRRTRGEVVHVLDQVQEDRVVVREEDHGEEDHEVVPWVPEEAHAVDRRAWGGPEAGRTRSVVVVDHVRVVRVHGIDLLHLRSNPYQRAVDDLVLVREVEEADRVVDGRETWVGEAPAFQGNHPFDLFLVASVGLFLALACSFCFAFSLLEHLFCFV